MIQVNVIANSTKKISQRIQEASQFHIRDLAVTIENNSLTLTGQASSFDHKKIAQDCALRFAPGSLLVRNQIKVTQ